MKEYNFPKYLIILLLGFSMAIITGLSACTDTKASDDTSINQVKLMSLTTSEDTVITYTAQDLEHARAIVREEVRKEMLSHQSHEDEMVYMKTNKQNQVTKEKTTSVKEQPASTGNIGLCGHVTLSDSDPTSYDVFRGKSGGIYIFRISKETGNEYKQYLKPGSKVYSRIIWE